MYQIGYTKNVHQSLSQPRAIHTCRPVMMGRKSAKIATRKGKTDAAKAKLYGKFGKMIAQEVRAGGPDPVANGRLKDVLAAAKQSQVPADIIERNLKKGSDKSSSDFSEMVYEAYGPGGTGFIIEALTDNVNRTAAEVRTAVTKSGGKMADSGSVLFNFSRTGLIMVSAEEDEDATFEAAIDAGASDVEAAYQDEELEGYRVLTSLEDYASVNNNLIDAGLKINAEVSGLVYIPLVSKGDEVSDEDFASNEAMYDKLMECDDVDAVYHNFM
jgi:YebC/PmpR family DNA-binding regulatory protein